MIYGIGIDLCEIERLERSAQKSTFQQHVYSKEEQEFLSALGGKRFAESAAANFAAKEAFLKAAGTGLGGFSMTELSVLRLESGVPYFVFSGSAAAWMQQNHLTAHLSLTHESGLAAAYVILEKTE